MSYSSGTHGAHARSLRTRRAWARAERARRGVCIVRLWAHWSLAMQAVEAPAVAEKLLQQNVYGLIDLFLHLLIIFISYENHIIN
jgi:hypothetical protein